MTSASAAQRPRSCDNPGCGRALYAYDTTRTDKLSSLSAHPNPLRAAAGCRGDIYDTRVGGSTTKLMRKPALKPPTARVRLSPNQHASCQPSRSEPLRGV
jgi:hypothetical protein